MCVLDPLHLLPNPHLKKRKRAIVATVSSIALAQKGSKKLKELIY